MEIGTEILLKRIKDCPEEFADHDIHGMSRWSRVLNAAQNCLPLDEFEAIKKAMEESRRQHMLDRFNEQVLKTLAGENTQEDGIGKTEYTVTPSQQRYGQGWSDPRGVLSQGGLLNSALGSNTDARGQQEMMQKQYAAINLVRSQATAEVYARYAADEKARNVGFFSKLGRKLFNAKT